jgi:hypothetical protein
MRLAYVLAAAAVALVACQKKSAEPAKTGQAAPTTATAAAPAAPIGPPHRRAGLWAQTMTTAGMHQTIKMCLDADTDAKMAIWGQAMGKNTCAKNLVTPTPGGWAFESECDMGGSGHVVSKGTATGDFNSRYTVKVSSTTTGSQMAQANGQHEMSLDAVYEGPCPAGMKGGDVNITVPGMKGGMTINMEKMAAMQK